MKISETNVARIVELKEADKYSEWLLKGQLGETYFPVAVVAAFYAGETISIMYKSIWTAKQLDDYKQQIATLELPERVRQREREQYQFLVTNVGERLFFRLAPQFSLNLRPSSVLVFSDPGNTKEESVYLISPTLAPPSPALRFIKRGVAVMR